MTDTVGNRQRKEIGASELSIGKATMAVQFPFVLSIYYHRAYQRSIGRGDLVGYLTGKALQKSVSVKNFVTIGCICWATP